MALHPPLEEEKRREEIKSETAAMGMDNMLFAATNTIEMLQDLWLKCILEVVGLRKTGI